MFLIHTVLRRFEKHIAEESVVDVPSERVGKRARLATTTQTSKSLLLSYLLASPECAELFSIWDAQHEVCSLRIFG